MNITGRLTADATVRTIDSGAQVVSFSIAKNKSYKNKQGERVQQTEFVDCSFWRSVKVAQFLTKGTLVELTGWITARAWTDSKGEAQARLNFRTDNIEFLGGGTKKQVPQQQGQESDAITWEIPAKTDKPKIEDDLPF